MGDAVRDADWMLLVLVASGKFTGEADLIAETFALSFLPDGGAGMEAACGGLLGGDLESFPGVG